MSGAHKQTLLQRLSQRKTDVAVWLIGSALMFAGCVLLHSLAVLLVAVGVSLMNTAYTKGTYRWERKP